MWIAAAIFFLVTYTDSAWAQAGLSGAAVRGGADVGTTSGEVLPAETTQRKGLHISNASDTRIWCAWGQVAVVGEGFFLDPGGVATYDDSLRSVQALNCLHASTGTKRMPWEVFR